MQVMSEIGVLCLLFAAEEGAAAFLADALPFWARFRLCLRAGIVKIAKEKMEGEGGRNTKLLARVVAEGRFFSVKARLSSWRKKKKKRKNQGSGRNASLGQSANLKKAKDTNRGRATGAKQRETKGNKGKQREGVTNEWKFFGEGKGGPPNSNPSFVSGRKLVILLDKLLN